MEIIEINRKIDNLFNIEDSRTLNNKEEKELKRLKKLRDNFETDEDKEIFCPMCKESCGSGMGSGRIFMLHHTVGCKEAKRY